MTLVMCHGVFDMLHAGHVEHLRQARAMGDMLLVSLVPDRFVTKPGRPIYTEQERLELVKSIRHVSIAELCDAPGPQGLIEKYLPNLYVRGSDYVGVAKPEDELLRKLGIHVRYTKSVPPTTTEIMERVLASCVHSE